MCATCGCGQGEVAIHHHGHHDDYDDPFVLLRPPRPAPAPPPTPREAEDEAEFEDQGGRRLEHLEIEVLAKNDALAARNRLWLSDRRVLAFNLLGGPGAGKTSLIECVLRELGHPSNGDGPAAPIYVLEGDQATTRDADRVRAAGARALQITTGRGCHLDAAMVRRGLDDLGPGGGSLLFIENVGNLVCPSLFDLGEQAKIVVLSVTEGEDKPLKYPHAFRSAKVLVVSKIDLLGQLDFDLGACLGHARQVNPTLRIFCLSVRTGEGVAAFLDWLRGELGTPKGPTARASVAESRP